jgi:hypothetical protein
VDQIYEGEVNMYPCASCNMVEALCDLR